MWLCQAEAVCFVATRFPPAPQLYHSSQYSVQRKGKRLQDLVEMSVFDALGAAATILQFVEYGIKFGNKVLDVYKSRSELAELCQATRDYQQQNEAFKENLRQRSPSPSSGEALLMKIESFTISTYFATSGVCSHFANASSMNEHE